MKIHIEQKFNFSSITPYRNFSLVSNKPKLYDLSHNQFKLKKKENYKRKNTKYFYAGTSLDISKIDSQIVNTYQVSKRITTFITINEKHINRYKNDPFTSIVNNYFFRSIKESEDKIHISLNRYIRSRGVNDVFFKKSQIKKGLVINKKTGDFYIYDNSKIIKNTFKSLYHTLKLLFWYDRYDFLTETTNYKLEKFFFTNVREKFKTSFNNVEFINAFENIVGIKKSDNVENIFDQIIKNFIENKKIKVPNDFKHYLINYYPTKKYLKNNDNKLIASVLDKFGIKSKSLIKLLHNTPTFNISLYLVLSKYIDKNILLKINHDILKHYEPNYDFFWFSFDVGLTNQQQKRFIKILNTYYEKIKNNSDSFIITEIQSFIISYSDHLRMYLKLLNTPFEVNLHADDYDTYRIEHKLLTDNLVKHQKSLIINLIFSDRFIRMVEQPIRVLQNDLSICEYYPVILKNTEDYYLEGKHMSHCVSSYIDREESIIVSIRKGNNFGHDRVTCEYLVKTKQLKQSRHFYNKSVPSEYQEPIDIISKKISDYKDEINVDRNEEFILYNDLEPKEHLHIF